jgi:hypothetical protein
LAVDVEPVRGEPEPRGRDLSADELRSLLEACVRAPNAVSHRQDAVTRRRRLSLLYASGLRRAEAVALELADLDLVSGLLRVRRGKCRKIHAGLEQVASPGPAQIVGGGGQDPSLAPALLADRPDGRAAQALQLALRVADQASVLEYRAEERARLPASHLQSVLQRGEGRDRQRDRPPRFRRLVATIGAITPCNARLRRNCVSRTSHPRTDT